MDWLKSQMEIESELLQIEQSFFNPLVSYDKIIAFCQKTLEEYRTNVTTNGFPDEASEIWFLKGTNRSFMVFFCNMPINFLSNWITLILHLAGMKILSIKNTGNYCLSV